MTKYSKDNLQELLNSGLKFWIADYKIAKENNKIELSNIIFEGIEFYKQKLPNEDQIKISNLLEETDYLIDEDYSSVDIEANALYIIESIGEEEEFLNEGVLSSAIGAIGGFAVGPAVGKIVADVLGIEKRSMLRDFFESRLVGSALGSAIVKNFGN